MTTFDLEEREHSDPRVRLFEVSGEVDLTNSDVLESRLEEVPAEAVLVLNLNRVVFVDSAALHSLFRVARARGPERFALVLERTAAIARTLEIAGLRDVVAVGSNADEVVAALAPTPG